MLFFDPADTYLWVSIRWASDAASLDSNLSQTNLTWLLNAKHQTVPLDPNANINQQVYLAQRKFIKRCYFIMPASNPSVFSWKASLDVAWSEVVGVGAYWKPARTYALMRTNDILMTPY